MLPPAHQKLGKRQDFLCIYRCGAHHAPSFPQLLRNGEQNTNWGTVHDLQLIMLHPAPENRWKRQEHHCMFSEAELIMLFPAPQKL